MENIAKKPPKRKLLTWNNPLVRMSEVTKGRITVLTLPLSFLVAGSMMASAVYSTLIISRDAESSPMHTTPGATPFPRTEDLSEKQCIPIQTSTGTIFKACIDENILTSNAPPGTKFLFYTPDGKPFRVITSQLCTPPGYPAGTIVLTQENMCNPQSPIIKAAVEEAANR